MKVGEVVEHTGDDLPAVVCKRCACSLTKRLRSWWWRRVGGGKWLAMRVAGRDYA